MEDYTPMKTKQKKQKQNGAMKVISVSLTSDEAAAVAAMARAEVRSVSGFIRRRMQHVIATEGATTQRADDDGR